MEGFIDVQFGKFADCLIPSDEYIKAGKESVQRIFTELQKKSRYSLTRFVIGGSIGKATSIMYSDFDCVVLLNDEQPLFTDVINEWEDILLMSEVIRTQGGIKKTKFSLQFLLENGFIIDLLPAANLVRDAKGLGGPELAEAQRQEVLKKIQNGRYPQDLAKYYSGSLVEAQIQFMKKQDSFAHQLVRMAKYWYKTVHFDEDEYIPGASTMMELIAVDAASYEDGRETKSLLRAFKKFLNTVSQLNVLKLGFSYASGKPARNFGSNEFLDKNILKRNKFLIEPANPYNDFLEPLDNSTILKFQNFARITIDRLEKMIHGGPNANLGFDYLFEPLPTVLPHQGAKPKLTWLVGTSRTFKSLNPDMKLRNEAGFKTMKNQQFLRGIQDYFQSTVASTVHGKGNVLGVGIQNRVAQMIDENIDGVKKRNWIDATGDKHEDFDVTLTVPIQDGVSDVTAMILSAKLC